MTTTETEPSTDAPLETPPAQEDPAAEVARLKAELSKARKWEDRAKENSGYKQQLEALQQQSMSDTEKAVAQAKADSRTDTVKEFAGKLVDAEIRAAAAGRDLDVDALLEGIDRSKFLGDDIEPNRDAITGWLDKVAPLADRPNTPDLGQGARGGQVPALNSSQLEKDLKAALGTR